jgi:hypothetical protein
MHGVSSRTISQKRKTHRILFPTIQRKKKPLETRSKPFKDKEKHMDFIKFGESAKLFIVFGNAPK